MLYFCNGRRRTCPSQIESGSRNLVAPIAIRLGISSAGLKLSVLLSFFFQRSAIHLSEIESDIPVGKVVNADPVLDGDGLLPRAAMAFQSDQDAGWNRETRRGLSNSDDQESRDNVLLESLSFYDIGAGFLLGTNDVPHPNPQRCLFIWTCCGVSPLAVRTPRLVSASIAIKCDLFLRKRAAFSVVFANRGKISRCAAGPRRLWLFAPIRRLRLRSQGKQGRFPPRRAAGAAGPRSSGFGPRAERARRGRRAPASTCRRRRGCGSDRRRK